MDNEERLIQATLKGDQNAFKSLVQNYQALIFSIIFNIVHNSQDTENIAQETFIQIYCSLHSYQGNGFKSWMARIATNKAIDWKRKEIKNEKSQQNYAQNIMNQDFKTQNTVEEHLLKQENNKELASLYSNLPKKYQAIINKYYFQSKSYKEIAQEENISVRTVESRLYRARQLMKTSYKEGG